VVREAFDIREHHVVRCGTTSSSAGHGASRPSRCTEPEVGPGSSGFTRDPELAAAVVDVVLASWTRGAIVIPTGRCLSCAEHVVTLGCRVAPDRVDEPLAAAGELAATSKRSSRSSSCVTGSHCESSRTMSAVSSIRDRCLRDCRVRPRTASVPPAGSARPRITTARFRAEEVAGRYPAGRPARLAGDGVARHAAWRWTVATRAFYTQLGTGLQAELTSASCASFRRPNPARRTRSATSASRVLRSLSRSASGSSTRSDHTTSSERVAPARTRSPARWVSRSRRSRVSGPQIVLRRTTAAAEFWIRVNDTGRRLPARHRAVADARCLALDRGRAVIATTDAHDVECFAHQSCSPSASTAPAADHRVEPEKGPLAPRELPRGGLHRGPARTRVSVPLRLSSVYRASERLDLTRDGSTSKLLKRTAGSAAGRDHYAMERRRPPREARRFPLTPLYPGRLPRRTRRPPSVPAYAYGSYGSLEHHVQLCPIPLWTGALVYALAHVRAGGTGQESGTTRSGADKMNRSRLIACAESSEREPLLARRAGW